MRMSPRRLPYFTLGPHLVELFGGRPRRYICPRGSPSLRLGFEVSNPYVISVLSISASNVLYISAQLAALATMPTVYLLCFLSHHRVKPSGTISPKKLSSLSCLGHRISSQQQKSNEMQQESHGGNSGSLHGGLSANRSGYRRQRPELGTSILFKGPPLVTCICQSDPN